MITILFKEFHAIITGMCTLFHQLLYKYLLLMREMVQNSFPRCLETLGYYFPPVEGNSANEDVWRSFYPGLFIKVSSACLYWLLPSILMMYDRAHFDYILGQKKSTSKNFITKILLIRDTTNKYYDVDIRMGWVILK